jgi:hypothetical protein
MARYSVQDGGTARTGLLSLLAALPEYATTTEPYLSPALASADCSGIGSARVWVWVCGCVCVCVCEHSGGCSYAWWCVAHRRQVRRPPPAARRGKASRLEGPGAHERVEWHVRASA